VLVSVRGVLSAAAAVVEKDVLGAVTWKGIGAEMLAEAGVEDLAEVGVAIPYRLPSGEPLYFKRIAPTGSWYEPSPLDLGGLIPLGLESVPWAKLRDEDVLFVTEGESDALVARERIAELNGRRVFTLGLPGAHSWRESWTRYLRPFSAVYVIPDGDESGQEMAKVRKDCRWARLVELDDGDDLRSLVQREGAEALLPLLDEATWLLQLDLGVRACTTVEQLDDWMRRAML
jgi:hypothetical protein